MPLDPDLAALLAKAAGQPPLQSLSVAEARAAYESRPRPPGAEVAEVSERVIEGPGGPLRLRLYRPNAAPGALPLLVFFHGSGFVLCSLDTHDGICRNLCAGAGCLVLSVDYRLAPETRCPTPTDDCVFATRWAALHAAELGADPARIAIGGDSAGGNMAAVTALRLRDEGGPPLAGQLLIYPVTDDPTVPTTSMLENAEGYGLTRDGMMWFWSHYLGPDGDGASPLASPVRAPDLARLPPAFVLTAEFDPLRDEGEHYAARLAAAGVATELIRYDGVTHGFFGMVGWVARAEVAVNAANTWLRARFA